MSSSFSRQECLVLASVCLAALMFGLEISSVPVILPTLERLLHGGLNDMQWVMNAYTIACTTVLMAAGTLADRYGRKRLFLFSCGCFGLSSLGCGLADAMPWLIGARFLQGVSGGAMLICLLAILSNQFPGGAGRSRAFACFGIVFGAGLGFGPLVGGTIVALSDWKWVFLVHAPLALISILLALASMRESRDAQTRPLDLAGIVTLSLAVLALTCGITQGPDAGTSRTTVVALLTMAVLFLVAFVWLQTHRAHPMFDFSVFRIRHFSGALLGAIGMNFSFWPLMIYLPLYYQAVLGYDPVDAGLCLLAYTLPTLVVPPLAERLVLRYQAGRVIPAGLLLIGAGFMAMWWAMQGDQGSWLAMLPGCLAAGTGLGLTNTPVTNTATGAVEANRAGMASGIDMSARLITLAINIAVMGLLLQQGVLWSLRQRLPDLMPEPARHALAQTIASGDLSVLPGARAALVDGFAVLLLYGAIGVWLLAGLSWQVFGMRQRLRREA